MNIVRQIVVFDAPDLDVESGFWASLLGGTVDRENDWHTVSVGGRPVMDFQLAPNHATPEWPDGEQQQQIHLDLYVDDVIAAHDEVIALGARLLKPADNLSAREGFQVYADPAGHPFCLCWA